MIRARRRLNVAPVATWWVAVILVTGGVLVPARAPAQALEQELEQARQRLGEARAAHLDLMAPGQFDKAARDIDDAADRIDAGGKLEDIRRRLHDAGALLDACNELRAIGEPLLGGALAARAAALTAGAPEQAAESWAEAEAAMRKAGRKLEGGDHNAARRAGAGARGLYDAAELLAIRTAVLQAARELRLQAVAARAEEYASLTLGEADGRLAEAESILAQDRQRQREAREQAAAAGDGYRHAARIARIAQDLARNKKQVPEQLLLDHEAQVARVAAALGFEPDFSAGIEPVTGSVLEALAAVEDDRTALRQKLQALQEENSALEQRLATLEAREAELRRREAHERTIREVQKLFTAAEGEVVIRGEQLVVRLYGLGFPSGSSEIRPANFALLAKVQRVLRDFPKCPVAIEGHTDSQGDDAMNQELSQQRANAVRAYLIANMQRSGEWMVAVGYGASRPIANEKTAAGRARNRRIDFVIDLVCR